MLAAGLPAGFFPRVCRVLYATAVVITLRLWEALKKHITPDYIILIILEGIVVAGNGW